MNTLSNMVAESSVEIVKMLFRVLGPNVVDSLRHTPLHYATRSGRVDVVKLLLKHGADPNAQDDFGNTSLHLATRYSTDEVLCIIESLLSYGANPDAQDWPGNTPLHNVLENPFVGRAIAELSIDYVKNVNVKNNKGHTPLHLAVEEGYARVVELLLLRGADPNARDKDGRTPLMIATEQCGGRLRIAELLS